LLPVDICALIIHYVPAPILWFGFGNYISQVIVCDITNDHPNEVNSFTIAAATHNDTQGSVAAVDVTATDSSKVQPLPQCGGVELAMLQSSSEASQQQRWHHWLDFDHTESPTVSMRRHAVSMTLYNNELYIAGGALNDSTPYIDDVIAISLIDGTQRSCASLINGRRDGMSCLISDPHDYGAIKWFVAGGSNHHFTGRVEMFDFATNTWTDLPRMITRMSYVMILLCISSLTGLHSVFSVVVIQIEVRV
jgi:hypothetical protein